MIQPNRMQSTGTNIPGESLWSMRAEAPTDEVNVRHAIMESYPWCNVKFEGLGTSYSRADLGLPLPLPLPPLPLPAPLTRLAARWKGLRTGRLPWCRKPFPSDPKRCCFSERMSDSSTWRAGRRCDSNKSEPYRLLRVERLEKERSRLIRSVPK